MSSIFKKCFCCCSLQKEDDGPDVQELNYHHASLHEVPSEIFTYERTLEKLDLGTNEIADLPPNLFHCHELRELKLCDNELRDIPAAIESLTRLAKLEISRNALSEIPESIKNCRHLSYLDLSINALTRLPEVICLLVNLEELFLNETSLEFLPANFGRLTKLKTLELRENFLQTLPKSMNRLSQLQKLDIGSNDIEDIPEVIGTMTNLMELWADNNLIRHAPKFLGNLTKLACLDLSKNEIREVDSDIGKCGNLEDVTLSSNSLTSLPDSFTNLEFLVTLRIDNNCIVSLPDDFGMLKNLQEFSGGSNLITTIPPSVGLLRKLHTLYIDENRLVELPKEIGSCISLTVLSVAKNNLKEIPSEVGHLSKLKMLNLTNNLIQNLPVSILGLTNLGALWLTDKQNKPLVTLNREIDSSSGQHVVTCCLLPQFRAAATGGDQPSSDNTEDEPRRSQRKIRFQNDVDVTPPERPILNGGLLRAPTPYPKELRAMAKHASQYRQNKGQNGGILTNNEPLFEDVFEEAKESNAAARHKVRMQLLDVQLQKTINFYGLNNPPPVPENRGSPKVGSLTHYSSMQTPTAANPEQKYTGSRSEGYIFRNKIAPQTFPSEAPSAHPIEGEGTPTRSLPSYEEAVIRSRQLGSSGGVGPVKLKFSDSNATPASGIAAERALSGNSFGVQGQQDMGLQRGYQDSYDVPAAIDTYQEQVTSFINNASYNPTNVQLNDNIMNPDTNTMEFNEVLSDNNANIRSSKPVFTMEDTMNANVVAPYTHTVEPDENLKSDSEFGLYREGKKQSSFKESRIPTAGKSFTPMKNSPSNLRGPKEVSPPSHNSEPVNPGPPSVPNAKVPLRKFVSGMQYEPAKNAAVKQYNSVSYIARSDMTTTVPKSPSASTSHIKQRSGIMKFDTGKNVADGSPGSASVMEGRKSQSRIPKFGSLKGEEAEDEKPPAVPQQSDAPEKSTVPRSGIPKLSSGREGNVNSTVDPKLASRKPWIFGSHKNARVESVEYRKVTPDRLGFTIDEFSGANTAPDGKGIYVTATDSNDLSIKVGDKILQVDGIDVEDSMGVAIVCKILANCQENIQFLVSRQQ